MKILLMVLSIMMIIHPLYSSEIPEFLAQAEGEVGVILKIADKPDDVVKLMAYQKSNITMKEKHQKIINHFKNKVRNSQMPINNIIENNRDLISAYKSYWISNAVYIKGDAEFIRNLAARNDVEYVFKNLPLVLVEPVEIGTASQSETGAEPGLDVIGARDAWQMGLTGKGRLVCNLDTGVDGNHPALSSSWRGANGASDSASWFDPYTKTTQPVDYHGHGTHTMGTIVGLDGADTIGVAFGAQWIAAGVVDRGGSVDRTIADILSAFEWAADPDGNPATCDDRPDVVSNSWGIPAGFYGACDMTFWDAIDNLEALGIVCLFAAGNEGPTPSTIRTPADRITTQFNAFSVGAVNSDNLEIASFSSRGPSGCDGLTIKPEITAPGVNIRSANDGGGYITMSGTSMATPHIAGAAALLRQFNPEASVEQIKGAMIAGAIDLGDIGEDNNYGYGLVNIMNSIYHMPPPNHPFIHIINAAANRDGSIMTGDTVSISFVLENIGSESNINAVINTDYPDIEIIERDAALGAISYLDTLEITAFSIVIPNSIQDDFIPFTIEFTDGNWSQVYTYNLSLDIQVEPAVATITTDVLTMSFSNFGQFGLGENSINPAGGAGFRIPADGDDFVKEAALLISVDNRVSDGVRDIANRPDNDFTPFSMPIVTYPGDYADYDGMAQYSDSAAEEPIGLIISQRCYGWSAQAKFITVEFIIHNISGAQLENLQVGLFCDWDMPASSGLDDIVSFHDVLSLGYFQDSNGECIGLRSITSPASSYRAIDNDEVFGDGFSEAEKIRFMTEGFIQTDYPTPDNYSHLLSVGPFSIADGDSEVVAFAFVAGESLNDLYTQADLAFQMYPNLTHTQYHDLELPEAIILRQNYPNPFNASTTIKFESDNPSQLSIYDVSGRLVKQFDILSTGLNQVVWDGTNRWDKNVVSGVYFYRLSSDGKQDVKKMIFLK
ncbi:MAG: S8 family peptidase [candidate division Zixibacteria bacterium]|nr:S8 family peptidase [candidate division Zixibacteria bacterium]